MLGAHNFGDPIEHGRVSFGVRTIKVHPDWDTENSNFDLAILKMVEEAQFNNMIRPVCLPQNQGNMIIENLELIAAGWGLEGIKISQTPRKVDLELVDAANCRNGIDSDEDSSSKSFCAQVQGRRDTCKIDDGSGIYQKINGKFYLKGIMSVEIENCSRNEFIVATEVSHNLDFVLGDNSVVRSSYTYTLY